MSSVSLNGLFLTSVDDLTVSIFRRGPICPGCLLKCGRRGEPAEDGASGPEVGGSPGCAPCLHTWWSRGQCRRATGPGRWHRQPPGRLCVLYSPRVLIVQSLSRVRLFVSPWTVARQTSLSFTVSQSLLKLTSIELVMPSDHLILCRPLLLPPSVFPSVRVFSSESSLLIR